MSSQRMAVFMPSALSHPNSGFAALLLGEKLSATQYIGAVCIIGGTMIGELVKERRAQEKRTCI